jgi:hypothetical protein
MKRVIHLPRAHCEGDFHALPVGRAMRQQHNDYTHRKEDP